MLPISFCLGARYAGFFTNVVRSNPIYFEGLAGKWTTVEGGEGRSAARGERRAIFSATGTHAGLLAWRVRLSQDAMSKHQGNRAITVVLRARRDKMNWHI